MQEFATRHLANVITSTTTLLLLLVSVICGRPAVDRRHGLHHGSNDNAIVHRVPLHVVVAPDVTTMDSNTGSVQITCLASTAAPSYDDDTNQGAVTSHDEIPYISFYWVVMEHTSMPLTNNMPGITINRNVHLASVSDLDDVDSWRSPPRKHHQRRRHDNDKRHLAANSENEMVVNSLTIDHRFYHVLRSGDNKLACKAYTLSGRRATGFFIVRKV